MDVIRYDIIDGPNRDLIFKASEHVFDEGIVIPIKFKITSRYLSPSTDGCMKTLLDTRKVKIEGIKHIGRTGHKLKLIGRLEVKFSTTFSPFQFDAEYDTVTRKGSIGICSIYDPFKRQPPQPE